MAPQHDNRMTMAGRRPSKVSFEGLDDLSEQDNNKATTGPATSLWSRLQKESGTRRRNSRTTQSLAGVSCISSNSRFSTLLPRDKYRYSKAMAREHRAVWLGRIGFVLFLIAAMISAAAVLYWTLQDAESQLAQDQFQQMSTRASKAIQEYVSKKRLSMVTMSVLMSEQLLAPEWPLRAFVQGYDRIVEQLAATGSHTNMGFAPIVPVEQQADWEAFAYDYFDSRPDFPNTTGINAFGKGIWRMNANKTRVHDVGGAPGNRTFLTPIFQCCIDNPGDPVLLFNLHSEPKRRRTIDNMRQCTDRAADNYHTTDYPDYSCGSMTEFVTIVRFKHRGPASIMFQPIWPADRPWQMTGMVLSPIVWDEIFENMFNADMDGVHCVLQSETQTHTYTIKDGLVDSFAEGDFHQSKYEQLGQTVNLTWTDLHDMGAPMYKLSIYPTDAFIKSYSTSNPRNAAIAAVSVILFTSLLFLLYDYFVRREFVHSQNLLEAKRKFIRYVSHEVRTPLNAVVMGCNVVQAEWMDASRRQQMLEDDGGQETLELLQEIQTSAESAVEVLNDVLNYDKIERSCLKLELSMVPILQLVERSVSEFRLPAAKKQVHLKLMMDARCEGADIERPSLASRVTDLPQRLQDLRVAGDAARLAQVLRNLLSNANKFTAKQGRIFVHARHVPPEEQGKLKKDDTVPIKLHNGSEVAAIPLGHLEVRVQDNGAGMTKPQLKQLFGEYQQFNVNQLQAGKGSGLGLFITKGLVTQHEGTLEGHSEGLGQGALFTLRLPVYQVPGENKEESSETLPSAHHDGSSNAGLAIDDESSGQLRLLVVDDVMSNRKLLARLLERKGHKCDMAENGQEAFDMIQQLMKEGQEYDSVLMDYEMPIMNGPTAACEIRNSGCDVFIVGITGNMLNEDVEYFKSQGANAVLPKPVQLSVLEDLWMEYGIGRSSTFSEGKA